MNNKLFRPKSVERISSPEQLNEYIRVSNPSVWMLLGAIVILLIGVCVWGVTGHLDTTLSVVAVGQDNAVIAYVKEADAGMLRTGMEVTIGENKGSVAEIAAQPVQAQDVLSAYMLHVGALQPDEWVYAAQLDVECASGVHEAQVVTQRVSPMSFVLN